MATSMAGEQTGCLLYVTGREPRLCFLVHTGSEVSIIPVSKAEWKNRQDTFGLLAANNSPIVTYGTRSLMLNLGLHRTFRWVFMVANVRNPILGTDFLKHYGLVVNMRCRRLLDTRMQLSSKCGISSSLSPSPSLIPKKPSNDFTAIIAEFPTITQPCSKDCSIKHDITDYRALSRVTKPDAIQFHISRTLKPPFKDPQFFLKSMWCKPIIRSLWSQPIFLTRL